MSSRTSTSSPDILGPSGDADYLVSSPLKPFPPRPSFMSPANLKLLQTPGSVKAKTSRFSPTPAKSAHSIRFDDVLLPTSPAMKFATGQRSLSPDKGADGNQSPWRIRVTLEATQDEDANPGSPARKRARQTTMTTKVPLKDESEQTPRRRRGRPRKSDALELAQTPTPAPVPGSPGHTPGPAGSSGQKRKRGRPKKSLPQPETVETQVAPDNLEDDEPQRVAEHNPEPTVESALESTVEPTRSPTPLNLAVDDGFDHELPDAPALTDPFEFGEQVQQPEDVNERRSSPRVTFDTPNVDGVDDDYLRIDEPHLNSTPSKIPSPPREDYLSPENTLHAGHTPMPPRRYPTPTSSSQVGDDRPEGNGAPDTSVVSQHKNDAVASNDPTDEHREFDSIMESEGFSMVSLDTLPSAKHHGLSANSDLKGKKGSLKPFMDRETTIPSKRRSPLSRVDENSVPNVQVASSPAVERQQSHSRSRSDISNPPVVYPSLPSQQSPPRDPQSSPHASAFHRLSPTVATRKKPLATLVKVVRLGMALEGALRNSFDAPDVSDLDTMRDHGVDLEGPRRRFERLFTGHSPEIQRQLYAGLELAHELAQRRILNEIEQSRNTNAPEVSPERDDEDHDIAQRSLTPPEDPDDASPHETPSSEMKRRMAEWQREREAISREIQMANSSQVIVIDSDEGGDSSPHAGADYYAAEFDSDQESNPEPEAPREGEEMQTYEQTEDSVGEEEDDGYEDIWQLEAHDQGNQSDPSPIADDYQENDHGRQGSSPWKSDERGKFSSPAYWTNEHDKVPFLGPSRIRELREQDVDLSGLLRAEHTPNRLRYYYGKVSPVSATSGSSPDQSPSRAESGREDMAEHKYPVEDINSGNYLETSPHRDHEDDFQLDPTTRFENSMQRLDSRVDESEESEREDVQDAALTEHPSADQTLDMTPKRPPPEGGDAPASSLFHKIASLTPAWLKAPSRKQADPPSQPVEDDEPDNTDDENMPNENSGLKAVEDWEETPRPPRRSIELSRERRDSSRRSSGQRFVHARSSPDARTSGRVYERPPPMTVSGYFSDEHYYLLRRLYRMAKKHPERFPYYPAPGRNDIVGDWIWTSDGTYGVPITERQFAIIDRFVQELAKHDIKAGGTGQIGWTEAELHRRLISIIIGEQVRLETKEQQQVRPQAGPSGIRGIASRLWR
ncbi:hypothetical protein BDV59DRAFT_170288 [Aspergillus ambiguus]|uniref:putative AT DNA binding protein n=1 Tax=Aspergillus ambiguus TaxID=176160 RepID=UPI003CCDC64E